METAWDLTYFDFLNRSTLQDLDHTLILIGCSEFVLKSRLGSRIEMALSAVPAMVDAD